MASSSTATNHTEDQLLKTVTDQWKKINNAFEHFPKFQNQNVHGVTDKAIKDFESKFKIILPEEIRAVIQVHNGRKHIGFGLGFRSPTTDLLPLSEWKPYENDNEEFPDDLFECLNDENDACAHKNLRIDAQEHLKAYIEGNNQEKDSEKKLADNKTFQSLPCELLIIGQGMDDYAEQYILSIRSGRIYLAVHNIPEWRLIGTFQDWIKESLSYIEDQKDAIKEEHDEIEVD